MHIKSYINFVTSVVIASVSCEDKTFYFEVVVPHHVVMSALDLLFVSIHSILF
jgi:hypothetical protein